MSKQQDFINKYGDAVVRSTIGTGIFPSVKLAQMAIETGWGDSIKVAANNAYGIKPGNSWQGRVISNNTFEDDPSGKRTYYKGTNRIYPGVSAALADGAHIQTLFRVYNDVSESIRDHSRLLLKKHYSPALAASTPEAQAQAIKDCGYATGVNYVRDLISIINKYNLKIFDEKKNNFQ